MCGIIGYTGRRPCLPVLMDGLEHLEYRGYDSAGVAWPTEDGFYVVKTQGRLANLQSKLETLPPAQAVCGIGHTRWATHGAPSDINSHPHTSGKVCLVHNGIIENYLDIKHKLQKKGVKFLSDTDTEVLVRLLDSLYDGNPLATLYRALAKVRGSYALAVLFADHPGKLWAVRRESPLIVGCGEDENFIASDIPALLKYTRRFILPAEGEVAMLSAEGIVFYDEFGNTVEKQCTTVNWDLDAAEKNGYPHFMLKEIHEQPEALHRTVGPRIRDGLPFLAEDGLPDSFLAEIDRIHIVGCGTAYHAGMVGKAVLEQLARIPTRVEIASEFRYADPILTPRDLVVIISQSGETLDTLAALRLAKQRGCPTLAVVNVLGSSIAREADRVLYTWAGPEIAVASTKAYTVQMAALYLLAFRFALVRGTAEEHLLRQLTAQLENCGTAMQTLLERKDEVQYLASLYRNASSLFYLGRGLDHALSLEGSLKLKEISYIHSEGYASGELKHGTISLIVEGTPVVALATQSAVFEKTVSNVKEVRARGASTLLICTEGLEPDTDAADHIIRLPHIHDLLAPLEAIIPLQLFAYYMSVLRGCDVDKPRNLAKSVTVE